MANDFKKVGLVFKTDGSTEFIKTLSQVNNEIKQNYENFRLTQAQYDSNTSTMDKLKDRYSYLNEAISLQTDKVNTLTAQLFELENAEVKDENAIEKKRIALTQAETSLQRYQNQQKQVNEEIQKGTANFEDFANKLQSNSTKITDIGKKASIGSAAVVGLGIGAIKVASDFDSSMSQVQAVSGVTGEELLLLRDKAEEMGAATRFSASESADAFYYMSLAGWDSKEMLEGIEPVLNLATAANMDLASASDIVTDYLTAFNLQASDAPKFVDQMTYAMKESNTNVSQLGEAYKNCAATSTQLGYSLEDTTAALMVMANSGIKGGEAGTALSSIMTRLGNNVSGCSDLLEEYGIEVYDSAGNVNSLSGILQSLQNVWETLTDQQKSNLSYVVAGKSAQSELMTILSDSTGTFEEYTNSLKECDGVAEEMANTMSDNLNGDLTQLKSQFEGIANDFGQLLMPTLRDFMKFLSSIITKISEMSPTSQKIILIVGLVIAALGPLLVLIGKMGTGISSLILFGTKMVSVFNGVGGAMSTVSGLLNIHTIVIAAVIAAVALLVVMIVKHWDEITGATKKFISGVKDFFQGLISFFTDVFNKDWSKALGPFGDIINAQFQNIKNYISSVKEVFNGIITFVKGVFTGNWKLAWQGVKDIFSGIFNAFGAIVKSPFNLIIGGLNGLITGINTVISGVNKIQIPNWDVFGSLAGKGLNIKQIGKISYLAEGGELLKGTAIVGEEGPEMLMSNGRSTKVIPLSNGVRDYQMIDYQKLLEIIIQALNQCKMKLDKDGFVRFIYNVLNEVV